MMRRSASRSAIDIRVSPSVRDAGAPAQSSVGVLGADALVAALSRRLVPPARNCRSRSSCGLTDRSIIALSPHSVPLMPHRDLVLAFVVLSLHLLPSLARAQIEPLPPIPEGATLRVWSRTTGTEAVVGRLQGVRSDTLALIVGRGRRTLLLPVSSIWRMDVSAARTRTPGAIAGGAIGLVGGGALGWGGSTLLAQIYADCANCKFGPTSEEKAKWEDEDRRMARATGIVAAGIGLGIGAWIGSRYLGHRWSPVSIPARAEILPSMNGVFISVRMGR